MKIGVIGMGVVGGATAEVFSKVHEILPYDKYKIKYEYKKKDGGFSDLNSKKRLETLANESDIVFICVDTPMKISGEIDYSSIHNSMKALKKYSKKREEKPLVVVRSTAVSGTTEDLEKKYPFHVAFNPEFLKEKTALEDMLKINRVVIGAQRDEDYKKVEAVYKPLFPNVRYFHKNNKTAEMAKYIANAYLSSGIAVSNEVYFICDACGVDFNEVMEIVSMDDRIAKNTQVPGPDGDFGFGGKCFPKDLNALIHHSNEHGYKPYLLEEINRSNNERFRKRKDWLNIKGATSKNTY